MACKENETMINIKKTTRERLLGLGRMTETYDTLLNRLMDEHDMFIQE